MRGLDNLVSGEELFEMLKNYCENISDAFEIDILDEDAGVWI